MARAKTEKRETPRRGRFSWFALVLLIAALVGFILALRPQSVESMWNRTLTDLQKRENVLAFARKALQSGTLAVTGEGKDANSAEAVFALPDAASLSVTGKETFLLTATADSLTLTRGEEVSSAPRAYALADYDASSFAEDTGDLALSLRRFLVLTETREDAAVLLAPYEKAIRRNLPRATRETVATDAGKETIITYEFDAKRLSSILAEWQKTLPGDEALRTFALDLFRTLYAAGGESAPEAMLGRVKDFLTGADGNQALLATGLAGGKGSVTVSLRAAGGRIIGLDAVWSLPFGGAVATGKTALDLGRDPAKAPLRTLEISEKWSQGGEDKTLFLSLKDYVKENSGSAYVREVECAFEDPFFRLLPEKEGDTGTRTLKVKYSWGKKRGDLGLRFTTEDKTVQFRGELKDYRAGKRAEIVLRRVEVDGENRIADQSYTVALRLGGTPAEALPGETELFQTPEPETAESAQAPQTP